MGIPFWKIVSTQKMYGLNESADYYGKVINNKLEGLHLLINGHEFRTQITGLFNVYNLLAIYAVASELGVNKINLIPALGKLKSVPGRFNVIKSKRV